MIGVVPVSKRGNFSSPRSPSGTPPSLMNALVSCHQLGEIDHTILQMSEEEEKPSTPSKEIPKYSGPTLDIKIFTWTGWNMRGSLVTSPDGKSELEILKPFEFEPSL